MKLYKCNQDDCGSSLQEDTPQNSHAVYIKVHVIPESMEDSMVEKGEVLHVLVREKAEQGAANRKMLELLRVYFGVRARVRIVSGHHSPHKIVSID